MAREAGRSLERAIESVDLDAVADVIGIDPTLAREWVDSAGSWLREQTDNLGDEVASRVAESRPTPSEPKPTPSGPRPTPSEPTPLRPDAFFGAAPHPLDLPNEEQGVALSALASGRWTVVPGTGELGASADGRAPTDARGVVRELRARDWINNEGELTLVGRHALSRWLELGTRS